MIPVFPYFQYLHILVHCCQHHLQPGGHSFLFSPWFHPTSRPHRLSDSLLCFFLCPLVHSLPSSKSSFLKSYIRSLHSPASNLPMAFHSTQKKDGLLIMMTFYNLYPLNESLTSSPIVATHSLSPAKLVLLLFFTHLVSASGLWPRIPLPG